MDKKIIYSLAFVVAIIALLWFFGGGNRPALESASSPQSQSNMSSPLSALETTFDFGSISMAGGNVSHIFKIKNISETAITVTKIYTSCMCTTATLIKDLERVGPFGMPGHAPIPSISEIIAPGKEVNVEVVFDPAAHGPAGVGKIERAIIIENKGNNPVELKFSAFVTP